MNLPESSEDRRNRRGCYLVAAAILLGLAILVAAALLTGNKQVFRVLNLATSPTR